MPNYIISNFGKYPRRLSDLVFILKSNQQPYLPRTSSTIEVTWYNLNS
jgi:hypothetical protein